MYEERAAPPLQTQPVSGQEIHVSRMRVAVLWSIIFQLTTLCSYVIIFNVNVFHPLNWLTSSLGTFVDLSLWLKLSILFTVICIQGEMCKRNIVSGPTYYSTRFQKIKSIISMRNLPLLMLYVLIGLNMFWMYCSISGEPFKTLSKPCRVTGSSSDFAKPGSTQKYSYQCLQEEKLFILAAGGWLGLYFFIFDYVFCSKSLEFPLIQQFKLYRLKNALKDKIKGSLKDSAVPTIIFIIMYYFYGGIIKKQILGIFSLKTEGLQIDTLQGLMNFKLMSTLWLFSSIYIIALQSMMLLFNIFITEHFIFPLTEPVVTPENCKPISLIDSLKSKNSIIRQLGFLDLCLLSSKFPNKRKEVFSLSFPGGHPHKWNGIFETSVNELKSFLANLSKALNKTNGSKEETLRPARSAAKAVESTFHFHSHKAGLRPLQSPMSKIEECLPSQAPPILYQSAVEVAYNNLWTWMNCKLEQIYKKPYISYFFMEDMNSRLNYILCQSQSVIWAVESLSFLVAASITEDRYGIVQRNLADVIIHIVELKQLLEKLNKQNLTVRRTFSSDPLELQMKYLLKTSVKRSLYKISITFGPYIKDLNLPTEIEIQMNSFIHFKEGL